MFCPLQALGAGHFLSIWPKILNWKWIWFWQSAAVAESFFSWLVVFLSTNSDCFGFYLNVMVVLKEWIGWCCRFSSFFSYRDVWHYWLTFAYFSKPAAECCYPLAQLGWCLLSVAESVSESELVVRHEYVFPLPLFHFSPNFPYKQQPHEHRQIQKF